MNLQELNHAELRSITCIATVLGACIGLLTNQIVFNVSGKSFQTMGIILKKYYFRDTIK